MHYDPFGQGSAKEAAGVGQAQDGNTSFDGGKGSASEGAPREHKPCSCKKSRCLKKYCECFSASVRPIGGLCYLSKCFVVQQKYCEGCYCTACENNPEGKPKHAVGSPSGGSQGAVPVQTGASQSGMPSTSIPSVPDHQPKSCLMPSGCSLWSGMAHQAYCPRVAVARRADAKRSIATASR